MLSALVETPGWLKTGCVLQPALMGSVDCWPMAIDQYSHSGAGPGRHPFLVDVAGVGYPPPEDRMSQSAGALCGRGSLCGGPFLGELSGGKWMTSLASLFGGLRLSGRAPRRPAF